MEISITDMILQSLQSAAPILGILLTTLVSIVAIRKTAEANKISNIHNEMLKCVVDSIIIIRNTKNLLYDISRKVVYYSVPEHSIIETAYSRYWREIQAISKEFTVIQSKQEFVLPKILYDKMQKLIGKINEARNEAKHLKPDKSNIYPDTVKLQGIIAEINKLYIEFVHEARVYVGVDALMPFYIRKRCILGLEEAEEPSE